MLRDVSQQMREVMRSSHCDRKTQEIGTTVPSSDAAVEDASTFLVVTRCAEMSATIEFRALQKPATHNKRPVVCVNYGLYKLLIINLFNINCLHQFVRAKWQTQSKYMADRPKNVGPRRTKIRHAKGAECGRRIAGAESV